MKCHFCSEDAEVSCVAEGDFVKCPSCGWYVANHLWGYQPYRESKQHIIHLIAGYLHEMKEDKITQWILSEGDVNRILQSPLIPKTSMQKLDKLLLNIYKPGNGFAIEFDSDDLSPAMGYVRTQSELLKMIEALCELGFVKYMNYAGGKSFAITIKGLERAESLLTEQNLSKKAFIAMRFSDDLKEVRDKSIKPACEACGFEAYTVDEEEHVGDITDKIISGIKTSRFVIADFTYNNPGVYYEAGYAKGLGIPVIKTCKKEWFESKDEKGEKNRLHFDVEHDNMILWENAEDLRQRLESRIQAVIL